MIIGSEISIHLINRMEENDEVSTFIVCIFMDTHSNDGVNPVTTTEVLDVLGGSFHKPRS